MMNSEAWIRRAVGLSCSVLGAAGVWACGGAVSSNGEGQAGSNQASALPVARAATTRAAPNTPVPPAASGVQDKEGTPDAAASQPDQAEQRVEGAEEACQPVGGNADCVQCVCERCTAALRSCAETPGCPEILECVASSGCKGRDCYCGSASITRCLGGNADGPCRDVILAAPGARAPTATEPSAGPASDAANAVGACADDESTCRTVCELGE